MNNLLKFILNIYIFKYIVLMKIKYLLILIWTIIKIYCWTEWVQPKQYISAINFIYKDDSSNRHKRKKTYFYEKNFNFTINSF